MFKRMIISILRALRFFSPQRPYTMRTSRYIWRPLDLEKHCAFVVRLCLTPFDRTTPRLRGSAHSGDAPDTRIQA